jgi:HD-GYP domain-containing protein (c-di-GMP phosphodiesterase class II)
LATGEDIPLPSRIIAIADAFDAMTSDRPYRRAGSRANAFEELRRCAGKQFDRNLVERFIAMTVRASHGNTELMAAA